MSASVDREIGQTDREVPAFLPQPLLADVEDLGGVPVAAREGVYDDRDIPRYAAIDMPGEQVGKLGGEIPGDLLGDLGRRY